MANTYEERLRELCLEYDLIDTQCHDPETAKYLKKRKAIQIENLKGYLAGSIKNTQK